MHVIGCIREKAETCCKNRGKSQQPHLSAILCKVSKTKPCLKGEHFVQVINSAHGFVCPAVSVLSAWEFKSFSDKLTDIFWRQGF